MDVGGNLTHSTPPPKPPRQAFSRLNRSSSFGLSLAENCSDALMSFMALAALAPVCPCTSCNGDPSAGHSTPDRTSPVLSRGENPIFWPAGNALPHAAREAASLCAAQVHYWLTFSLESTRTPKSLSVKLLPRQSSPSLYRCMGLFFPRCRIWYFPLSNLMRFRTAHFSSLLMSLWMVAQPSDISSPLNLPLGRVCIGCDPNSVELYLKSVSAWPDLCCFTSAKTSW